ncbi:MAG: hypothetical protein K0M56_00435 [Kaistella sp.]|nr:hypothetical protein [Kaistella sp.]
MAVDFLELLKFIQEKKGVSLYNDFLVKVAQLREKSGEHIEINIPEKLLEEFLRSKSSD